MIKAAGTFTLNDGTPVPAIGLGTYNLRGEAGTAAMVTALESGYRYLDSAVNYDNEVEVGEALRRSGIPRDQVQVATKVPGRFHAHDLAIASIEDSLRRMRLDVLDMVLVHWPNPSQGRSVEVWEALVDARERGLTRSIGVSNYTAGLLDQLIAATGVTPSVNQIELHPRFPQADLRAVHARLGILTQTWSPLARMEGFAGSAGGGDPVAAAAAAHGVSAAQVLVRWHLQMGCMPLPKSADPARQAANLDIDGFALTTDEMSAITGLDRPDGRLWGGDPLTNEEM